MPKPPPPTPPSPPPPPPSALSPTCPHSTPSPPAPSLPPPLASTLTLGSGFRVFARPQRFAHTAPTLRPHRPHPHCPHRSHSTPSLPSPLCHCPNLGSSPQHQSEYITASCRVGAGITVTVGSAILVRGRFCWLLLLKTPGETPDCKESLARKSSQSRLESRITSEKDLQILELTQLKAARFQ